MEGIALDPVPQADDVLEGTIEELPLADASADWIWCRDVLVHVDVERGLAECARVLKPGGRMLAYVTLATDLLEPREAAWIDGRVRACDARRRPDRGGCRRRRPRRWPRRPCSAASGASG